MPQVEANPGFGPVCIRKTRDRLDAFGEPAYRTLRDRERDHDAAFEQQRFDVVQAQVKPEIPANRATDDDSREPAAVI